MSELEYSTLITGVGFRLYDFKEISKLIQNGLTDSEIKQKVFEDNILQLKKSTTKRAFPTLLLRANAIDETLRQWVLDETTDFIKIINFYAILKTDLLFFEFMDEVIKPKLQNEEYIFEIKDLNIFFNNKAEQSEKVSQWSESTTKKLKSSYKTILKEMGFLDSLKSIKLNRLFINEDLKTYFIKIGDEKFVETMEG